MCRGRFTTLAFSFRSHSPRWTGSKGPKNKSFGWTSDGEVCRGWFRLLVFEVSRGPIRVATFRCPEFALVLFKSIFVEPLESFVLLFVRLVFKTRRVDRFSTFSASPRRANNEKKTTCDFFSLF